MAGLQNIPLELRLMVASLLDKEDLLALRLTCTELVDAAEEKLYEKPVLQPNITPNLFESNILTFLCSIRRKPKLATLVKSLTIHPLTRLVGFRMREIFPGWSNAILDEYGDNIITASESDLVSLIVKETPRLKSLDLKVVAQNEPEDPSSAASHYISQPLRSVFGQNPSLSEISGLTGLTELHFESSVIDWQWCKLPTLESLYLGRGCRIEGDVEPGTSNLKTLKLQCPFNEDEGGWEVPDNARHFFRGFSHLATLTLYLSNLDPNIKDEIYAEDYETEWDTLFNQLRGIRDTVETLEIHMHENWYLSRWTEDREPAVSLQQFPRLRTIRAPYSVFCDSRSSAFEERYPLGIETVEITHAMYFSETSGFFKSLVENPTYYSSMKTVNIFPRSYVIWGVGPKRSWEWDSREKEKAEAAFQHLTAVGISVKVWEIDMEED